METHPIVEQFGRLQRWAVGALQPARGLLQGQPPQGPSLPGRPAAPRHAPASDRAAPAVALRRRAAPFAAIIPGDTVVEQVISTGLYNFINLYNTALIIRLVLTWFPNPPEAFVTPLATVCDPYLNLFRGVVPPIGGTLDLSPILAFLVLNVFQGTAAALPCELPPEGTPPAGAAPGAPKQQQLQRRAPPAAAMSLFAPSSRYQQAWARRVVAQQQRRLAGEARASA
ncbi:hypothetical protein Rsub_10594 [Raphidocelis subcapitata]|uniref:YggT family protein n=1 Tax=Raphidocelis subcapitata TaxID=307507 RepID=A0A2V0PDJ2_9CHLO|nr:hypothetical protein Rsub_10594 [Raphidocelis subcapitata]|eukprot:GBF97921.1 hypothetical protein Rsub_10594 [Raphidocelis subcapitata]